MISGLAFEKCATVVWWRRFWSQAGVRNVEARFHLDGYMLFKDFMNSFINDRDTGELMKDGTPRIDDATIFMFADKILEVLARKGVKAELEDWTNGPLLVRLYVKCSGVVRSDFEALVPEFEEALDEREVVICDEDMGQGRVGVDVLRIRPVVTNFIDIHKAKEVLSFGESDALIGVDVSGKHVVNEEIAEMRNLLVAGETGCGKSMFLDSLIMSILVRSQYVFTQFALIDTADWKFECFRGIPHLVKPVAKYPWEAVGILEWAMKEMARRATAIRKAGAKDFVEWREQGLAKIRRGMAAKNPEALKGFFDQSGKILRRGPNLLERYAEMKELEKKAEKKDKDETGGTKDKTEGDASSEAETGSSKKGAESAPNGGEKSTRIPEFQSSMEFLEPDPVFESRIVIVISEIAHLLMLKDGKVLRNFLEKLKELGKKTGVHLIAATRWADSDIIDPAIWEYFESRAVFKTESADTSELLLGSRGAEKLKKTGDMFFQLNRPTPEEAKAGSLVIARGKLRIHTPFVNAEDKKWLGSVWREAKEIAELKNGKAENAESDNADNAAQGDKSKPKDGTEARDYSEKAWCELLTGYVMLTGDASPSLFQAEFGLDFNFARKLHETLVQRGVIIQSPGGRWMSNPDYGKNGK